MSTRALALRGGSFLAARQLASLLIGLGGTVLLTRLLGPAGYGRFAAALALYTYLFSVAQLGLNAWLVRREGSVAGVPGLGGPASARALGDPGSVPGRGAAASAPDSRIYATARSLLLANAIVAFTLGALLLPLVERWLGGAGVRLLALAMLAGLPLHLLTLVPLAAMERELRFRSVAGTELVGMLLFYVVSVALALAHWGPMAIVIGWWVQQLWLLVMLQRASGTSFAFGFDAGVARAAFGYGLSYASSIWTWQLRELVNPLIVGRWLGVEGVALVALSVRLVDATSFVKAATWRLALPALARLQREPLRLANAVRDGMRLQLLTVGPALLALALLGPMLVPRVFGDRWIGVGPILPLIAAGTLVNAMFNLHSSALYAMGRNLQVTLFHIAFVLLFASVARVLVPLIGVGGYGIAELMALPAYLVVFVALRRATTSKAATTATAAAAGEHAARQPDGQGAELWLGLCLATAVAGSAWSPWFALVALLPALSTAVREGAWATMADLRHAVTAR